MKLVIKVFIFSLFSLLFFSCPNVFGPDLPKAPADLPQGMGFVTLSITDAKLNRMIVPEELRLGEFTKYDLLFKSGSGNIPFERTNDDLTDPMYIPEGTWELEIDAYYGVEKVATGSVGNIVISAGGHTPVEIVLSAVLEGAGEGTFRWTVGLPAEDLESARIYISSIDNSTFNPIYFDLDGALTSELLPIGRYQVKVEIIADDPSLQPIIFMNELLVYQGLVSILDITFTNAHFFQLFVFVDFNNGGGIETLFVDRGDKLSEITDIFDDTPEKTGAYLFLGSPAAPATGYTFDAWYNDDARWDLDNEIETSLMLIARYNLPPNAINVSANLGANDFEKAISYANDNYGSYTMYIDRDFNITASNLTTASGLNILGMGQRRTISGMQLFNNDGHLTLGENILINNVGISAGGDLSLKGNASVTHINLNASSVSAKSSLIIASGWNGNVENLNLGGSGANIDTVISWWVNQSVLSGDNINMSTIARIGLGSFNDGSTSRLVMNTHVILLEGDDGILRAAALGSANNPFLVITEADLRAVGRGAYAAKGQTWALTSHYRLMADISLDASNPNNWTRIGGVSDAAGFSGTFDGGGYTITGMTLNGTSTFQGMFGFISTTGVVRNLKLVNLYFNTSFQHIGGIAGANNGRIENCFVSGIIYSTNTNDAANVGGIVGISYAASFIINCFSSVDINAFGGRVGGVAGQSNGTLSYCYATGGIRGAISVGGILGFFDSDGIKNNVALNAVIARNSGSNDAFGRIYGTRSGGTTRNHARNDIDFNNIIPAIEAVLDGKDGESITLNEWSNIEWWQNTAFEGISAEGWAFMQAYLPPVLQPILEGFIPENPIIITNREELGRVGRGTGNYSNWSLHAHYRLDAPETIEVGEWTAIPGFYGSFDGNWQTLSGLSGIRGLFTSISANSVVKNLSLENINIVVPQGSGGSIGGLVGENFGRIENCSVTGSITSTSANNTGGIVGYNITAGSVITNCFTDVNINSADNSIGGIVGILINLSTVSYCLAIGNVRGNQSVGGIVGSAQPNSIVHNNVALNTLIVRSDGSTSADAGRITGSNNSNTNITNNYARNDMFFWGITHTVDPGLNTRDGFNITSANWDNNNWWQNTAFRVGQADGMSNEGWLFMSRHFPLVFNASHDIPQGAREEDPIIINTEEELRMVGRGNINSVGYENWTIFAHYRLDTPNPIDLTGKPVFPRISGDTERTGFRGSFNGNGNTIIGMTVNGTTNQGMFGFISSSGVVRNLGLENITVTGTSSLGGLAGGNAGTVENCFVINGNITSTLAFINNNINIGGLVGNNSGIIQNCYATGTVTSISTGNPLNVGGITGNNSAASSRIINCYTTVNITTEGTGGNVGGITGNNATGAQMNNNVALNMLIIRNGDLATATYGRITGANAGGLSNNYALSGMVFGNVNVNPPITSDPGGIHGADIASAQWGSEPWWRGTAAGQAGFTNPWWNGKLPPQVTVLTPSTAGAPYFVEDEDDLVLVGRNVVHKGGFWSLHAHYRMTRNMELDAANPNNWTRIGGTSQNTGFLGSFDGNGFTIKGMNVNGTTWQGMFGFISSTGVVRNLGLENVSITGSSAVGGIAGQNDGIIERSFVSGVINGTRYIGGIAGINRGSATNENIGIIRNVFSTANVLSSSSEVGGIVGDLRDYSRVTNSYSTGLVQGTATVGGIAGNGVATTTKIENSVALNAGVIRISGTTATFGRIIGATAVVVRTNNYARNDIILPVTVTSNAAGVHGLDINPANQWSISSWWQNTVFRVGQADGMSASDWTWWQSRLPQSIPPPVNP